MSGEKLNLEHEIPEAIENEQTADESDHNKKDDIRFAKSNIEPPKLAKSRIKAEKANRVMLVPGAPSNDSSVRKMVSIYAPRSFRKAEGWRLPIVPPSKPPESKKAPALQVPDQVPFRSKDEVGRHQSISEIIEPTGDESQIETKCDAVQEDTGLTQTPSATEKGATELVASFCERFSNWDFFAKCNNILELKFERIKSTSGVEFRDLPDSKKLGLAEDIITQALLKASPNTSSAPNLKRPAKIAVVRTVSEILDDVQRAQSQPSNPLAPAPGCVPVKVSFQLPPAPAEPGPCLDYQTFLACIRRIAERLGRAELATLLAGPPPAPPPPAARWAALPSVVTWNLLPAGGAVPARRRPDPRPADPPATPWTQVHRKSALRPRTSVRRLLALQDRMRQAHSQRVTDRGAKAEAEAERRRRLLAAQREKELFDAQRVEIKRLLLQKAEHGLVERRRQHAAEERRGRFEEVRRALPGVQSGAPAEAHRAGASPVARDPPAHGPGPPPLYVQLRRKEESRSLGGRLGFDCRLL